MNFSLELFEIYLYFHSLPDEISKIQYDEDEQREEIANAIDNLYGINGVLNTPFKAFEALVKKQIEDLKAPIEKCIHLVVEELKNAVRNCTQRVSDIVSHVLYFRRSFKINFFLFIG